MPRFDGTRLSRSGLFSADYAALVAGKDVPVATARAELFDRAGVNGCWRCGHAGDLFHRKAELIQE